MKHKLTIIVESNWHDVRLLVACAQDMAKEANERKGEQWKTEFLGATATGKWETMSEEKPTTKPDTKSV